MEEEDEIAGGNIQDLRLQHNELRSLDGSLFLGMKELQRLNLSHNALGPTIGPRDLRGLDGLRVLDISHNQLTTLEDTSEVNKKQRYRVLFSVFLFCLSLFLFLSCFCFYSPIFKKCRYSQEVLIR